MGELNKYVTVVTVDKEIISDIETIPAADGIDGGIILTGFLDVEKM